MRSALAVSLICFCSTAIADKVLSGGDTMYETTPEQIEAADIGTLPADYAEVAIAHIKTRLKDPYSAVITPEKPPFKTGMFGMRKENIRFYWVVSFMVNAKNSYGGYAGSTLQTVLFKDGKIVPEEEARKIAEAR